jgi:hypothetical protein
MAKKQNGGDGIIDSTDVGEKVDISDLEKLSDAELDKALNEFDIDALEEEADDDFIEEDLDVDGDDIDGEESDVESEDTSKETKKPNDNPVVRKYEAERKKRQELEAKLEAQNIVLRKYTEVEAEGEIKQYREAKRKKYIDAGYEESLADSLADDLTELYKESRVARPKEPAIDKYATAVAELKVSDEFFDNADAYADKISEKMKKFDISAREAYMLVVDPISRQKEISQRKVAGKKTAGSAGDTTRGLSSSQSATGKPGDNYGARLSKGDERVFQQLLKYDPSGNWTRESYRKLMLGK